MIVSCVGHVEVFRGSRVSLSFRVYGLELFQSLISPSPSSPSLALFLSESVCVSLSPSLSLSLSK